VITYAVKQYGHSAYLRDQRRSLTLADLHRRVVCLANGLTNLGLNRGDCVAVYLENSLEYLEIRLACYKAGFVFSGLIEDFTDSDIERTLREIRCRVLIFDHRLTTACLKQIKEGMPALHLFSTSNSFQPDSAYEDLLTVKTQLRGHFGVQPDEVSAVGFTSGTSGKSKAVVWSHQAWLHSFFHLVLNTAPRRCKMRVFLHLMPFATSGSLTVLPAIGSGCDQIIMDRFEAARVAHTINAYKVTDMMISPSFMTELWDYYSAHGQQYDFSSLCCVNIGSAPLPTGKLSQFIKTFGPIFRQGYGLAEVLAPLASHTEMGSDRGKDELSTVGKPIPQIRLSLADQKKNRLGRILIKSKTSCLGYWENGGVTNSCFQNGWFPTSDWGYADKWGRLYIVDRESNLIRRGNSSVFAREIEEVIHRYPGIKDVCVCQDGGSIKAWFSERRQYRVDLSQLSLFCQNHIPALYVPDCFARLNDLPLSSSGKIVRYKLDQMSPLSQYLPNSLSSGTICLDRLSLAEKRC
jgi:long-chain acyl-CoA synthetase